MANLVNKKLSSSSKTKKSVLLNWENLIYGKNNNAINNMVDLVKYPVITEKTYIALFKNRQYTFDVDVRLNKSQIKKLFENLFSVNVISINTHIPPRKKLRVGIAQGYRPVYKRAIITLKEGQVLPIGV